jgi:hypothetical protein
MDRKGSSIVLLGVGGEPGGEWDDFDEGLGRELFEVETGFLAGDGTQEPEPRPVRFAGQGRRLGLQRVGRILSETAGG